MSRILTLKAFNRALDCYGSDLEQWPPDLRRRAERLLAISAAADEHVERESIFDSFLRSHDPVTVLDPQRRDRIIRRVMAQVAASRRDPAPTAFRSGVSGPWLEPIRVPIFRFVATAATAACLGMLVGHGLAQRETPFTPPTVAEGVSTALSQSGVAALFRQPRFLTADLQ